MALRKRGRSNFWKSTDSCCGWLRAWLILIGAWLNVLRGRWDVGGLLPSPVATEQPEQYFGAEHGKSPPLEIAEHTEC